MIVLHTPLGPNTPVLITEVFIFQRFVIHICIGLQPIVLIIEVSLFLSVHHNSRFECTYTCTYYTCMYTYMCKTSPAMSRVFSTNKTFSSGTMAQPNIKHSRRKNSNQKKNVYCLKIVRSPLMSVAITMWCVILLHVVLVAEHSVLEP